MREQQITENPATGEIPTQAPPLVLRCIDFRTNAGNNAWLARRGFAEGSYHVYASAGASGNPEGFLEAVQNKNPSTIKVLDHEDCGFYRANGLYVDGDAPHQTHHHNLEQLGASILTLNPNIDYRYNLLPLNKEERKRHTCSSVVIALGEPDIILAIRQAMATLGLANDYDKIARPYSLDPDDSTIWNDLQISLSLHNPSRLFIFERSEQNARDLAAIAMDINSDLSITRITVPKLPQLNDFATIRG